MVDVRYELAAAIARNWNSEGVEYAIVRGLSQRGDRVGRDLDLAISRQDIPQAATIAAAVARAHGFTTSLARWSHWGLCQVAFVDKEQRLSLPLDFMCTERVWRAKYVWLADSSVLQRLALGDDRVGPFRISHEGWYLKTVIRNLLCGSFSAYADQIELPAHAPPSFPVARLDELLGAEGHHTLGMSSRPQSEKKLAFRRLQRRWIRSHPLGALRAAVDAVESRVARHAANGADVLVLRTNAPDVVEMALTAIQASFLNSFVRITPVRRSGGSLELQLGLAYRWRKPPVSEFEVIAVVDGLPATDSSVSPAERVVLRRAWRRSYGVLEIPAVSAGDPTSSLFDLVIDFLAELHSLEVCLRDVAR